MHLGKYSPLVAEYAKSALVSDYDLESGLPWVTAFEKQFAEFTNFKYAISVNSGTSGLHAALVGSGVKPGDEVISPALTVVMDAFATLQSGAIPVFVDVDELTWNISPEKIKASITSKTKAIIAVSWFGLPTNLIELKKICNEFSLVLIDDSAETVSLTALEPNFESRPHARVFSFESKKHLSTGGEGGMVVTDDKNIAEKIRKFAGIGYKHLTAEQGRTSLAAKIFQNPKYERFGSIGFNYRMTPITAAIGLAQLKNSSNLLNSRIKVASLFSRAVRNCNWLIPQPIHQNQIFHTYYTFGVRYLGFSKHSIPWEEFYDRFIELGGHGFYANCKNPYLEPALIGMNTGVQILKSGLCPVAEKLQSEIMAFKTNYLDLDLAAKQALILENLIDSIGR